MHGFTTQLIITCDCCGATYDNEHSALMHDNNVNHYNVDVLVYRLTKDYTTKQGRIDECRDFFDAKKRTNKEFNQDFNCFIKRLNSQELESNVKDKLFVAKFLTDNKNNIKKDLDK